MINANDMMTYTEKLQTYKKQVEMYKGILLAHNWIAVVGAFTVGLDLENKTKLEMVEFPCEFTREGVDKIINGCTFCNRDGDVKPKAMLAIDWYNQQIQSLELIVSAGL